MLDEYHAIFSHRNVLKYQGNRYLISMDIIGSKIMLNRTKKEANKAGL